MSAHIHLPQIFLEAVGQIYFENGVLLLIIIVCVESLFIVIPSLLSVLPQSRSQIRARSRRPIFRNARSSRRPDCVICARLAPDAPLFPKD